MMALGFVYFVFLPSVLTTPLGGPRGAALRARGRASGARSRWPAPGCRCCSRRSLVAVLLAGMVLVGVGHLLRAGDGDRLRRPRRDADRGSASGIYLACYFSGGLVGSAVLGQVFDVFGWAACVAGIGLALAAAALLAFRLRPPAVAPAPAGIG